MRTFRRREDPAPPMRVAGIFPSTVEPERASGRSSPFTDRPNMPPTDMAPDTTEPLPDSAHIHARLRFAVADAARDSSLAAPPRPAMPRYGAAMGTPPVVAPSLDPCQPTATTAGHAQRAAEAAHDADSAHET